MGRDLLEGERVGVIKKRKLKCSWQFSLEI